MTYIGPTYVFAQPQILPEENDGGCDDWLRAWIHHDNLGHRNASFPIEAF